MKSKLAGTFIVIILGLIMVILPVSNEKVITESSDLRSAHIGDAITADELAHLIIDKDPSIQVIDLRQPGDFESFHIKSAINIPADKLLESNILDEFDSEKRLILYTNDNTLSVHAQALLRQYGLRNTTVLLGGVYMWRKTFDDPQPPTGYFADAALGRYEFRRSAGIYLLDKKYTFAEISNDEATVPVKVKARPRRKRKKSADEGC